MTLASLVWNVASPKFRSIFKKHRPVRFIGAHNGLTARLGQRAGFDAIWASGLEITASLGLPDANVVSPSEIARACSNIASTVSIPVLVDMDSGYGNASQVYYYVRELARAGVHGVSIEDKPFPKSNSFSKRPQRLESKPSFIDKINAALDARPSATFWIVARTEAFVAGRSLAEAVDRAEAYADSGADAVLVQSRKRDTSEIASFCAAWQRPIPIIAIPTKYYHAKASELHALGVGGVIYANQGLRASIAAIQNAYASIVATGSSADIESSIASLEDVFELQGDADIDRLLQAPKRQVVE